MAKTIITLTGSTIKIEGHGYTGGACTKVADKILRSAGIKGDRKLKHDGDKHEVQQAKA